MLWTTDVDMGAQVMPSVPIHSSPRFPVPSPDCNALKAPYKVAQHITGPVNSDFGNVKYELKIGDV